MTISLICNIVTFVCGCVLFYNFRKAMRLYSKRREMYDELYKDYTKLQEEAHNEYWSKNRLANEVSELENKIASLSEGATSISGYKAKIGAITEEYEKQNDCHIERMVLLGEDGSHSYKRVYVEM